MPKLFNYYRYEGFINESLNKSLLKFCNEKKEEFTDAKLGLSREKMATNTKYRICKILNELGNCKAEIEKLILDNFTDFCQKLKIKPFEINSIELQIAAHGDGAFFKQHIDTHTEIENNSKNRVISAVFYFFNEPKRFDGGELVLYPFPFLEGSDVPIILAPINNSMVIFPSFGLHEVLPVIAPDIEFKDYRFAINCWINKA